MRSLWHSTISRQVADMPHEYRELSEHLDKRPPNESVGGAYDKRARIAFGALRYRPTLRAGALKRGIWPRGKREGS